MRILIAEDERSLNEIIAKKLTSDGYSVDACFDGEEAISVLSYTDYDAVILDIMMPKVNGFEVIKKFDYNNNHYYELAYDMSKPVEGADV